MWELENVGIRKCGNQLQNIGGAWTSEENEKYQKWAERDFEEKRLLGGWGQLIESLQEAYTNLGRLVQKGCISD